LRASWRGGGFFLTFSPQNHAATYSSFLIFQGTMRLREGAGDWAFAGPSRHPIQSTRGASKSKLGLTPWCSA